MTFLKLERSNASKEGRLDGDRGQLEQSAAEQIMEPVQVRTTPCCGGTNSGAAALSADDDLGLEASGTNSGASTLRCVGAVGFGGDAGSRNSSASGLSVGVPANCRCNCWTFTGVGSLTLISVGSAPSDLEISASGTVAAAGPTGASSSATAASMCGESSCTGLLAGVRERPLPTKSEKKARRRVREGRTDGVEGASEATIIGP